MTTYFKSLETKISIDPVIKYEMSSKVLLCSIVNLRNRLNVEQGRKNEIVYYSSKGHLKISRIEMLGGEML